MIYVFIWQPMDLKLGDDKFFVRDYKTIGEFERYFGHASLLVESKSGQAYLSYWPDDPDIGFKAEFKTLLRSTVGMKGKFMSYEEDISGMIPRHEDEFSHVFSSGRLKGEPDEIIEISSLNEEVVYSSIIGLTESPPGKYNFFKRNCSTLVASVLQYGAQNCKSDKIADAKIFASRAWEIFKTIAAVNGVIKGEVPASIILHGELSPTRVVLSLVEIIGFTTPRSVEKYAKRLADLK